MAYQCRQCNRFSNEAGACPVCNIPMDIKLQNDMPDTTIPVVPAVDATPDEVAPVVDPKKAPMPDEVPLEAPLPEVPMVEETPAEGGDPTVA